VNAAGLPDSEPPLAGRPQHLGVGARLRAERERAGLGLRELARRIGVSASLVSQIEKDKVTPSVGTLYAMVTVLGISMDALFGGSPGASGAVVTRGSRELPGWAGPLQRASERKVIDLGGGVRWERLTAHPDRTVEFLYVVYEVGGASAAPDALMRHGGHEYGYVLSGLLGVTIAFETYELEPGDSISFASNTPHRLFQMGNEPATAIWVVVGRQGDPRVDGAH
jgi:transcriptional regulator with XRE-family HTH domain